MKTKKQPIVTKEWLLEKIKNDPYRTIGRALVAIFNQQTEEEKGRNNTRDWNARGFTKQDGRIGTITAKYYLKHRTLLQWMVDNWMQPNRNGVPRILKYAGQLNKIAESKRTTNDMAILQTFNAPKPSSHAPN